MEFLTGIFTKMSRRNEYAEELICRENLEEKEKEIVRSNLNY